jgi:hypothetical protein
MGVVTLRWEITKFYVTILGVKSLTKLVSNSPKVFG